LARHFRVVVASDAAFGQLSGRWVGSEGVKRCAALAEQSPFADRSVDLVVVAAALHWFDLERFYSEVRRAMTPDGILAAWAYSLLSAGAEVDPYLQTFFSETVGPYWPPERRWVDCGYRGLPFPFARVEAPRFEMETSFSLDDLAGYLGTWSAVKRFRAASGDDPVPPLIERLHRAWGRSRRRVVWPLHLLVGRSS
jgi:SAM-dependent methyltransferase